MKKRIVISAVLNQRQVGIVENGRLVEYYLEQDGKERLVGNIYKARVENVIPGMGAAFVDLGMDKNGYLLLKDLPDDGVRDNLKKGDTLLVQVSKEAAGTKGPRVTTDISLPGRYLVLMPFADRIGVSRQISDEEERVRLYEIAENLKAPNMGLIIRTVAEGCLEEEFQEDFAQLVLEWNGIVQKQQGKVTSPLLYQDNDLVYRILRDYYAPGETEIVVDQRDLQAEVVEMLIRLGAESEPHVELYQGKVDIFVQFGLDKELRRARNSRVWLDCGGYLVFDQTEALLSIDVNTGKYVGGRDLQSTILKTNLQAAAEIPHQLRLRNIGGIVIIDFIDMAKVEHREAVLDELATYLSFDKTRTNLLGFTRLGLVELTRQKSRKPLTSVLETDCPLCQGSGRVAAEKTIAFQIANGAVSLSRESEVEAILIRTNPSVAAQLIGVDGVGLAALEQQTNKTIFVRGDDSLARHDYQLLSGCLETMRVQAYPVKIGQRLKLTITETHTKSKDNGVARIDGFIIECLNCQPLVGQTVEVEITEIHKTSAVARLVNCD